MLGFAVIDAQDDRVAVWLVSRTERDRAASTNAVVADRSENGTVDLLTSDRIVLLAPGVASDTHTTGVDLTQVIDCLSIAGSELRAACRRQWPTLRLPEAPFDESSDTPPSEQLFTMPGDSRDLPKRTVAWANSLIKAWSFWLATESVRHRKVTALRDAGKDGDLGEVLGAETFAAWPDELRETARSFVA